MVSIVSLGSINADFEVRVDALPHGPGTRLARDLLRTSGGKAANVAVIIRRLGGEVRLVGCVGDDDLAVQALAGPRAEGVETTSVCRIQSATGFASIQVAADGDKTIVLAPNANDRWPLEPDHVARTVTAAPAASVLVADVEIPPAIVVASARAARDAGMRVVLDPAPPERVSDKLLGLVDHLTPDHHEAEALTGIDARSRDGARRAAAALRARGVAAVSVKLSGGGCVVACDGRVETIEAPEVRAVDTTGAGDAFTGALAWAVASGCGPAEAAGWGVAASAYAVQAYGSQAAYPTLDELTR
jgi:ribokinase